MESIAQKTLALVKKQSADNYAMRKQDFLENLRDEFLAMISETHSKIQTDIPYEFKKKNIGNYSSYEIMRFGEDLGFTYSQDIEMLYIMITPHDRGREKSILEKMMDDVNEELHEYIQLIKSQAKEICLEIEKNLQSLNYTCVQTSENSYLIVLESSFISWDSIFFDEIQKISKEEWHFQDVILDAEENKVYLLLEDNR